MMSMAGSGTPADGSRAFSCPIPTMSAEEESLVTTWSRLVVEEKITLMSSLSVGTSILSFTDRSGGGAQLSSLRHSELAFQNWLSRLRTRF